MKDFFSKIDFDKISDSDLEKLKKSTEESENNNNNSNASAALFWMSPGKYCSLSQSPNSPNLPYQVQQQAQQAFRRI